MVKKITNHLLNNWSACEDGKGWFRNQTQTNPIELVRDLGMRYWNLVSVSF